MEAVRFDNVKYSYRDGGADFAVNGVTLSVGEGEFVAVLGRNGSGKSTLAKLINALLVPTEGSVKVFGMDTSDDKQTFEIRRNAGMVFQNPDNQTVASVVEDDVAFGPENIGVPREEIGRRIDFALDAVGMQAFRRATPARLSGGQKQRIAIAGVLAIMPKILILDESTAMLDPKGRREVMDVVKRLNREQKMTVLLITHFMDEALEADRAIVMHRGEVVMDGAPEEIFARSDELETYNLTLPRAAYVCKKLQAAGMPVADSFTAEELAEAICASLQKG
ncbi:MAG TPA: energy-coupling factor transporter ATPase [Candidatus Borkfalkia avicola]|uniref:Energy-coupling factor transporter ATPase n=1 Tax=Candidatus Borkfalkia avicola TaxID=2838503 RepID=A0A9D2D7W8_9FIRM|nr:energy-coupling factor transporter ATPase [Candidatus Borkfalkia avicola]